MSAYDTYSDVDTDVVSSYYMDVGDGSDDDEQPASGPSVGDYGSYDTLTDEAYAKYNTEEDMEQVSFADSGATESKQAAPSSSAGSPYDSETSMDKPPASQLPPTADDETSDKAATTLTLEVASTQYDDVRKDGQAALALAFAAETDMRWNEQWQALRSFLPTSVEDTVMLGQKTASLVKSFEEEVARTARTIIQETPLDPKEKTIKPADLGGIAGGMKFFHNGIIYKFALDDKGLYGGDEYAMKAASMEYLGAQAVVNGQHCVRQTSNEQFVLGPLLASVDWCGFRLTAMSVLPLGKDTLKYGSADGCKTMHNEDVYIAEHMKAMCHSLNLAGHVVGKDPATRMTVYGPGDIEGHVGKDNRRYVIDTARIFPPEAPVRALKNSYLYRLLRPEIVRSHPKPISSDAFAPFGYHAKDPLWEKHNREAFLCTKRLFVDVIPQYGKTLDMRFGGSGGNDTTDADKEETKTTAASSSTPSVTQAMKALEIGQTEYSLDRGMHAMGINMRHLGRLRECCKTPVARAMVLEDMVVRTLKTEVRRALRKVPIRVREAREQARVAMETKLQETKDANPIDTVKEEEEEEAEEEEEKKEDVVEEKETQEEATTEDAVESPTATADDAVKATDVTSPPPPPTSSAATTCDSSPSTPAADSPAASGGPTQTEVVAEKEGYLIKRGGIFKTWRQRYFRFHAARLCYFKSKDDAYDKTRLAHGLSGAQGHIDLAGASLVRVAESRYKRSHCFGLQPVDTRRLYVLQAADEEDLWDWLDFLLVHGCTLTQGHFQSYFQRRGRQASVIAEQRRPTLLQQRQAEDEKQQQQQQQQDHGDASQDSSQDAPGIPLIRTVSAKERLHSNSFEESVAECYALIWNVVFSDSPQADDYWKRRVKSMLARKFFVGLTKEEAETTYDLRTSEHFSLQRVHERLCAVLKIQLSAEALQICAKVPVANTTFVGAHFEATFVRLKATSTVPEMEAMAMMEASKTLVGDEQANMYKMAAAKFEEAIKADSNSPTAYINYGGLLQRLNRNDDAMAMYMKAYELHPANSDVLGNIAIMNDYVLGNLEQAKKFYELALAADPQHPANMFHYMIFMKTKLHDTTHPLFSRPSFVLRSADPRHMGTFARFCHMVLGDYARADKFYASAMEKNSGDANAVMMYAHFLSDAMKQHEKALQLYTLALSKNESDPQVHLVMGALLSTHLGRHEEGIKHLQRAVELSDDMGKQRAYSSLATALAANGQEKEALEIHQKMQQVSPSSSTSVFGLVNIYRKAQRWDDALKTYDSYFAACGGDANIDLMALLDYAKILRDKGAAPDVVNAAFLRAAASARLKKHSNCFVDVANHFARNNDLAKAEELYKEAVTIDPRNYQAHCNYAGLLAHPTVGRVAEAAAQLVAALSVRPEPTVAMQAATLYVQLQQPQQAITLYNNLLQASPTAAMMSSYAKFLMNCGQLQGAVPMLQQALQLEPNNAEILGDLGACILMSADQMFKMKLAGMPLPQGANLEASLQNALVYLRQACASPTPPMYAHYNVACATAMLNQEDECRAALERGKQLNQLPPVQHMQADANLASVRDKPWFQALMQQ